MCRLLTWNQTHLSGLNFFVRSSDGLFDWELDSLNLLELVLSEPMMDGGFRLESSARNVGSVLYG